MSSEVNTSTGWRHGRHGQQAAAAQEHLAPGRPVAAAVAQRPLPAGKAQSPGRLPWHEHTPRQLTSESGRQPRKQIAQLLRAVLAAPRPCLQPALQQAGHSAPQPADRGRRSSSSPVPGRQSRRPSARVCSRWAGHRHRHGRESGAPRWRAPHAALSTAANIDATGGRARIRGSILVVPIRGLCLRGAYILWQCSAPPKTEAQEATLRRRSQNAQVGVRRCT